MSFRETEFWARNPWLCIRECSQTNQTLLAFDAGLARKKSTDANTYCSLNIAGDYRCLLIGSLGAVEMNRFHNRDDPVAVYPVWEYGRDPIDLLEKWCSHNRAADSDYEVVPGSVWSAIPGQEHRVVVAYVPGMNTAEGKKFMAILSEIQDDYPDCIIHIHGLYSAAWAFGTSVRSCDLDPRVVASKGKVVLPNGKEIIREDALAYHKWLRLVGISVSLLETAQGCCIATLLGFQWGSKNWHSPSFESTAKSRNMTDEDFYAIINNNELSKREPPKHVQYRYPNTEPMAGDRLACDYCSLARTCRAYRVGSICTLPDSDTKGLADFFQSRNTSQILDGLGKLLASDVQRYELAVDTEERVLEKFEHGEWEGDLPPTIDKNITALSKDIFGKAVQLAKLNDPSLNAPGVQVNVQQNNAAITAGESETHQVKAARVMQELNAAGVSQEDITLEMVKRRFDGESIETIAHEVAGSSFDLPVLDVVEIGNDE